MAQPAATLVKDPLGDEIWLLTMFFVDYNLGSYLHNYVPT
jgi:hypothetical protein